MSGSRAESDSTDHARKSEICRGVHRLRQYFSLFWTGAPQSGGEAAPGISPDIICVRCGLCCTDLLVKLAKNDMRALARGLRTSNHELLHSYVRMTAVGPVLRQAGNRCVFLAGGDDGTIAVCRVYGFRPEVCRSWVPSLSRIECQEGVRKLDERERERLLPEAVMKKSSRNAPGPSS